MSSFPCKSDTSSEATIASLLEETLDLLDKIQAASLTTELSRRCEQLKNILSRLQRSDHAFQFVEEVKGLKQDLERADSFLKEVKKPSGKGRKDPTLRDINSLLHKHTIDLILKLRVELPEKEEADCSFRLEDTHVVVTEHQQSTDVSDEASTASTASLSEEEEDDDDGLLDPNYIEWDFSPAPAVGRTNSLFGSSNSSASTRDLRLYYARIQALRRLPPSTRVSQIRVCLAKLDAGDTTPAVRVGQTLTSFVAAPYMGLMGGMAGGVHALVTGRNLLGTKSNGVWQDATFNASAAFQFANHSFLHYLLEFDLLAETEESTITGTLERCVEDVYLYQGESSREHKKCVFYATPDKLTLRDLIQCRNVQRQMPYQLRGNNCKDFVWRFLMELFHLEEPPPHWNFASACQTIYGNQWEPSDFAETIALVMKPSKDDVCKDPTTPTMPPKQQPRPVTASNTLAARKKRQLAQSDAKGPTKQDTKQK